MGSYRSAVDGPLVLPARVLLVRGYEQTFRLLQRPIPAPASVRLVIDTGSKRTSIVPSILGHLRSPRQGTALVETSLAARDADLFWVRMEFPGTSLVAIPLLLVARLSMPASLQAYQGVIGRDVLSR